MSDVVNFPNLKIHKCKTRFAREPIMTYADGRPAIGLARDPLNPGQVLIECSVPKAHLGAVLVGLSSVLDF